MKAVLRSALLISLAMSGTLAVPACSFMVSCSSGASFEPGIPASSTAADTRVLRARAPLLQPLLQALYQPPNETLHDAEAPADEPTVLAFDECTMAIRRLYLQFDPEFAGALYPVYRDLARSLSSETMLTIGVACEKDARGARLLLATAGFAAERCEYLIAGQPLTVWARDRLITLVGSRGPRFLKPDPSRVDAGQSGDLIIADLLASEQRGDVHNGLFLEGGNVVVGDGRVFIGVNTIDDNAELVGNPDQVTARLRDLFGTEPLIVGERGQAPHAHIDMYLTAVGDDVVLLADPRPALELLRSLRRAGLQSVLNEDFGEVSEGELLRLVPCYEAIRAQLTRAGLQVERIPILQTKGNGVFTWNNALLERRGAERRAYLPSYGIPALDDAAAAVYQAVGYRVFRIDVSRIAHLGGTVRCMTNVLAWDGQPVRPGADPTRTRSPQLRPLLRPLVQPLVRPPSPSSDSHGGGRSADRTITR